VQLWKKQENIIHKQKNSFAYGLKTKTSKIPNIAKHASKRASCLYGSINVIHKVGQKMFKNHDRFIFSLLEVFE
jgi:hypothetical protein